MNEAAAPPARHFGFVGEVEHNGRTLAVGVNLSGVYVNDPATGEGWRTLAWSQVSAVACLLAAEPPTGKALAPAIERATARQAALPGLDGAAKAPEAPAPATGAPTASEPATGRKRRQTCPGCRELWNGPRNVLCAGCESRGIKPGDVGAKVANLSAALANPAPTT